MSKEKEEKVEQTDREKRWEAFLVAHAKQNPVKHAQRLAAGELKVIPASFK